MVQNSKEKIVKTIEHIYKQKFTLGEWETLKSTLDNRFNILIKQIPFTVDSAVLSLYGDYTPEKNKACKKKNKV